MMALSHQFLIIHLYLSIIFISLDRFVCIWFPFKHKCYVTGSNLRKTVILLWITSFVSSLPPCFFSIQSWKQVVYHTVILLQGMNYIFFTLTYLRLIILVKNRKKTGRVS